MSRGDPSCPSPLCLPPELLTAVFRFVSDGDDAGTTWFSPSRNRNLVACSLVSTAWSASAYPVLYGDLRLLWRFVAANRFLETFASNPSLLPLVRRFSVESFTRARLWAELLKKLEPEHGPAIRAALLRKIESRYRDGPVEGGTEGSASGDDDSDPSDTEDEGSEEHTDDEEAIDPREWVRPRREARRLARIDQVDDNVRTELRVLAYDEESEDMEWSAGPDAEGIRLLFRLVSRIPRLQHLAIANLEATIYPQEPPSVQPDQRMQPVLSRRPGTDSGWLDSLDDVLRNLTSFQATDVRDWAQILARMSHLEALELDVKPHTGPAPGITLSSTLRSLRCCVDSPVEEVNWATRGQRSRFLQRAAVHEDLPALRLLRLTSAMIETASINIRSDEVPSEAVLIATFTNLSTPRLRSFSFTPTLPIEAYEPLAAFLSTSTSLASLTLPALPFATILSAFQPRLKFLDLTLLPSSSYSNIDTWYRALLALREHDELPVLAFLRLRFPGG